MRFSRRRAACCITRWSGPRRRYALPAVERRAGAAAAATRFHVIPSPMNGNSARTAARELAWAHIRRGDPLGWFDVLSRGAGGQASAIPWADLRANPNLSEWLSVAGLSPGRALVIGCGLGDDAEL